jgi:hypothetical protein
MKKIKSEKGQALILIALAVVGLVSFSALAIDGGRVLSDRRHAQNTADTSVLAAALAKINNEDYVKAAEDRATNNGYTTGVDNTEVIVVLCNDPSIPVDDKCQGIDAASPSNYIRVRIHSFVPTTFARVLGRTQVENTVEAIARVQGSTSGSLFGGAGIVALNKSGCGIEFVSSVVKVNGGGIFVNSGTLSGDGALCSNWAPQITTAGGCIDVVGKLGSNFTNGSQTITGPGFCTPKPAQVDPPDFSAMVPVPPAPPPCGANPGSSTVNTTTGIGTYGPGNYTDITVPYTSGTFASGTYCLSGKLTVTGGSHVTGGDVIFVFTNPDKGATIGGASTSNYTSLQIFTHNGSWVENGSTTLTVPGVFRFYATGTAGFDVAGGSVDTFNDGFLYLHGGVMDWEGSTTLNLKAPTSGPYKGVAIFSPISNTTTMTIHGGSAVNVTGSILHPGGAIHMNGSSNATGLNCQIIGDTVSTDGGSNLTINYNPDLNIGSPSSPTIELTK